MRPGPTAAGQEREEENSRGSATLSLGTKVRPDLEIGLTRRSPQNLASTSLPSVLGGSRGKLWSCVRSGDGKAGNYCIRLVQSVRRSPMLIPSDEIPVLKLAEERTSTRGSGKNTEGQY